MKNHKKNLQGLAVFLLGPSLLGLGNAQATQLFLDLSSVTSGGPGTAAFSGSIGGVGVSGSLLAGGGTNVAFNAPSASATSWDNTIINNSSPQFSYSGIYTPTQTSADQIGLNMSGSTGSSPTQLTVTFASAVTNVVLHVANMDSMQWDLSPSFTAGNLSLLSGNGGGGDGLVLNGTLLQDANPATLVGVTADTTPPTTGARSAYGSLLMQGTYTSFTINLEPNPGRISGDGSSFSLSLETAPPLPEPSSLALFGLGSAILAGRKKPARKAA